jgi:AraC family transcriptional regulator
MVLNQFPQLGWLKAQISQGFADRNGPGNRLLETDGFPSVIINTTTKLAVRPDVKGPISIFTNVSGSSICTVEGRRMQVTEDVYCLTNRQQHYTLEIDSRQPVETCNIHAGERFSEQVMRGYTQPAIQLLNNGEEAPVEGISFYNKLYRKDEIFNQLAARLLRLQGRSFNKMLFDETMAALLVYLLQQNNSLQATVAKLPPLKAAVKAELYKRLSLATDYIHAGYLNGIQLDDIAAAACLSKFHFIRLFKQVHGVSPYQYIQRLRMDKAMQRLAAGESVQHVADMLGYDNANSLSRIFKRRTGQYPTRYRN